MIAVEELAEASVPVSDACTALRVARASFYRHHRPPQARSLKVTQARPSPARALTTPEREKIRDVLNSPEFVDETPRQVFAQLLARGEYLASVRTMYRVLELYSEVKERRQAARDKPHAVPVLVARQPNEVWSWDITKLKGPAPGVFFFLYVIIDIFSRLVVGWTISRTERARLATDFIEATAAKQELRPDQLVLHADRGAAMRSHTLSEKLIELGIERSHSRPRVSNDNPFSEAQFKTLKYEPSYPERFGSLEHAWQWARRTFPHYNDDHYHGALGGLLTPSDVHYGRTEAILADRDAILLRAYDAHPERFVNGPPRARRPLAEVWINPPVDEQSESNKPAAEGRSERPSDSSAAANQPPPSSPAEGRSERPSDSSAAANQPPPSSPAEGRSERPSDSSAAANQSPPSSPAKGRSERAQSDTPAATPQGHRILTEYSHDLSQSR